MKFLRIFLFLVHGIALSGQDNVLPSGLDVYEDLDRLVLLYGTPDDFQTFVKPYSRRDLYRLAVYWDSTQAQLSGADRLSIRSLITDNSEYAFLQGDSAFLHSPYYPEQSASADYKGLRAFFSHFYKTGAHLYQQDHKDFTLRVNPLLNLNLGPALSNEPVLFANQRGMELRASIDGRVFVYANILESQSGFADYVDQYERDYLALPGVAFYKTFPKAGEKSRFSGFDYLMGQGAVAFRLTPHIGISFGNQRNFIGDGYRSLFLSDFAPNYLNLKINWQFGRFHYQNLFAEVNAGSNRSAGANNSIIPKKYLAAHHLSYQAGAKFRLGIFESVTFARSNHFEFNYLNPFIFYRAIEGAIGSPDNVQLGLDATWNPWRGVSLYSQFLVDELQVKELFGGDGWWGNKYGIQAGLKYKDAFHIGGLDFQAEYNLVRPYTYSHFDSIANYSHQNQPLAHPLGANFREMLFQLQYQATPRLQLQARMIFMARGEDSDTLNAGGNILLPNQTRSADYGVELLQGNTAKTLLYGLDIRYEWFQQFYIELLWQYRRKNYEYALPREFSNYISLGIRWNLPRSRFDF